MDGETEAQEEQSLGPVHSGAHSRVGAGLIPGPGSSSPLSASSRGSFDRPGEGGSLAWYL